MNLRQTVEADLAAILEDGSFGAGWPITVVDPDGNEATFTGLSGDISQLIAPDTGQAVSGRLAHVTLRISSINDSILVGLPRNIIDKTSKPWLVTFDDINGSEHTFKVAQGDPDRTIGVITCLLELWEG